MIAMYSSREQHPHKSIPVIFWSGGLDSTYAVYDYLKQGKIIDIVLLDMMNEGRSVIRQEKATNLLLHELRKLMGAGDLPGTINRIIHHRISSTSDRGDRTIFGIHQVSSYFEAATYMLKDYNKELVIGYVKDDIVISYLDDFREAWRLMMKIQRLKYSREEIPFDIPIVFPYKDTTKQEMLSRLPQSISDNLSWCNVIHEYDECGYCKNCRIMSTAVNGVLQTNPGKFSSDSRLIRRVKTMDEINENYLSNQPNIVKGIVV